MGIDPNTVISNGTTGVNFGFATLNVDLSGKDLRGSTFEDATVTGTNFSNVIANSVSFIRTNFDRELTLFTNGSFRSVDFTGSSMRGTTDEDGNPSAAILGANFKDARWHDGIHLCDLTSIGKCMNSVDGQIP